jgi:hypothetical protein
VLSDMAHLSICKPKLDEQVQQQQAGKNESKD